MEEDPGSGRRLGCPGPAEVQRDQGGARSEEFTPVKDEVGGGEVRLDSGPERKCW